MEIDEALLTDNTPVIHRKINDLKLLNILNPILSASSLFSPTKKHESLNITSDSYNFSVDILKGEGYFDRLQIPKKSRLQLIEYMADIFTYHSIFISGSFLYKPGQAMGWHTNNDANGLRIYITHVSESKKSFFKYKNLQGDIITSYDNDGWWYRMFKINKEKPLWHCVYSDTFRYSIGVKTLDNLKIR